MMVIKMENDFDGSTPTCEKPKNLFHVPLTTETA